MHFYEDPSTEPAQPGSDAPPPVDGGGDAPPEPVQAEAPKADEPAAPAEGEFDLYKVLTEGGAYDEANEPDASTVRSLSPEAIRSMDDSAKVALAAAAHDRRKLLLSLEADRKKLEDERAAFAAEQKRSRDELQRRQLAFSKSVADPAVIAKLREQIAAKPAVVNPNDPASIEALVAAKTAEAVMASMAPAAEKHDAETRKLAARNFFVNTGLDPDNTDDRAAVNAKIADLYLSPGMAPDKAREHIAALTAAAARSGAKAPTLVAAELVAAERKAKAERERRQEEVSARIAGARSLGTASSGRSPAQETDDEYYARRMKEIESDDAASASFDRIYKTDQRFARIANSYVS